MRCGSGGCSGSTRTSSGSTAGYECRDLERTFDRLAPERASTYAFRWFPVDELTRVRLFPAFLRTALHRLPRTLRHLVVVQQDQAGAAAPRPSQPGNEPVVDRA